MGIDVDGRWSMVNGEWRDFWILVGRFRILIIWGHYKKGNWFLRIRINLSIESWREFYILLFARAILLPSAFDACYSSCSSNVLRLDIFLLSSVSQSRNPLASQNLIRTPYRSHESYWAIADDGIARRKKIILSKKFNVTCQQIHIGTPRKRRKYHRTLFSKSKTKKSLSISSS